MMVLAWIVGALFLLTVYDWLGGKIIRFIRARREARKWQTTL